MAKLYPGTYSPFLNTYDDIRDLYRTLHRTETISGQPLTSEEWLDVRRSCRVVYRRPFHDHLARPLSAAWRTFSDDNGETGIDFRILPEDPDAPMTDEEISEYMHDSEVYYGRGRYDFDCSGERFTRFWTSRRTPAGIVLLHYWGTDI